jgi:hypothetical protein
MPNRPKQSWLDTFSVFVFLAALVFNGFWLARGLENTLMEEHSFRQTQTALSAWIMANGGPFLRYETPLLGAPWSIPFEFPLYQWLSAELHNLTSLSLEASGRLVSRTFALGAMIPMAILLQGLGFSLNAILLTLALYTLSPLYLYWSRTFLIESTALFFALAYLAAFHRSLSSKSKWSILLVFLFGSMAALVKVTTFLGFAFASALLFANQSKTFFQNFRVPRLLVVLLPSLGALLVGIAWTKYADTVKGQNPMAEFIGSAALNQWNFGTLEQRMSLEFWNTLFRRTIHDSIGHRTIWLLSLGMLFFIDRRQKILYLGCFLSFLAAPLLFTNLHIVHNYYWYANGIFLVMGSGVILHGLLERRDQKIFAALGPLLFLLFASHQIRHYHNFLAPWQFIGSGIGRIEKELDAIAPKDKPIIILGAGWFPGFTYYAKRRALTEGNEQAVDGPKMQMAIRKLYTEGTPPSALLICMAPPERQRILLKQAKNVFRLSEKKGKDSSVCEYYLIRELRASRAQ